MLTDIGRQLGQWQHISRALSRCRQAVYISLGAFVCCLVLVCSQPSPALGILHASVPEDSVSEGGASKRDVSESDVSESGVSELDGPAPVVRAPLQKAQQLNSQGQQALLDGEAQAAFNFWQQAEDYYLQSADELGVRGAQLNQAKALQEMGYYRRAQGVLLPLTQALATAPASLLKLNVWLTHGQGLRLLGDLPASYQFLADGLTMADGLAEPFHQQAAHMYLGNTLVSQQRWPEAMAQYRAAIALPGPLQLASQLHQLQLLPDLSQTAQLPEQTQQLVRQLLATAPQATGAHSVASHFSGAHFSDAPFSATLFPGGQTNTLTAQDASTASTEAVAPAPLSARAHTYLLLELSHWWLQQRPDTVFPMSGGLEAFLQMAVAQAQQQSDRRAEAYGWGYLGQWYEQQRQWPLAAQSTQQALALSTALQADELTYQWQWQQGRIDKAQNHTQAAIAHYVAATQTLKPLRQEIVAITRDVQFSFRDEIKPIYRDLVQLLLSPQARLAQPSKALEQARQTLEDLQLAELNNFFREPCVEAVPQALDTLDPTAAVFYPILLNDQLAVILSLPGQALRYYATPLSQGELNAGIRQLLDAMRPTSFAPERMRASRQLYKWLIEPAESALAANNIETLTFVLDDALRSLPIAALHSGEHYLVEDYQLAISPGLQLLQVTGAEVPFDKASALIGGLSVATGDRPALVGVKEEIDHIQQLVNDAQVLLDESFTGESLLAQVKRRTFDVVHLATHAQFGETDADTFIETWSGPLQINQLRQLLRQQDIRGLPPALLVLSACDTAQGNDKAVLGMAGLAVRSGAQSTLATLWRVNDRATATFIQYFYDGLVRQGLSRSGAIRYAQQQLIQSSSFSHPYYWAPFVLVGDWT